MLRFSLLLLQLSCSAHSLLLGWVESPGYPSGYPPHSSLNWSRCAPKGQTLSIRLIHLDMEESQDCENDGIKVFSNENIISVLCGQRKYEELQTTVNPFLFSSPGGCLRLLFHSDYSNIKRHTGFKGFYTIQDFDECKDDPNTQCSHFCNNFIGGYRCSCRHGYHLAEDKQTCTVSCTEDLSGLTRGEISSTSWPGAYAENSNCQYTLSVQEDLQLELHFSEVFDVEQSSDGQCIDTLTVVTHSGTLGPFCGQTPPPPPLLTHSHHIHIRFTSDGFGTNKGFSLRFRTRDKVCGPVVTSHSSVTPQNPEYNRGQTVTVNCDVGYVVNTEGTKDLSLQYETTCQSTGVWTPSYPCEPLDCGLPLMREDSILQLVDSAGQKTQYNNAIQFVCNSEYYSLKGDDTYTCNASGIWVSASGMAEIPKCIEVCGTPSNEISRTGRILGGEKAELGEIPWQLLIKSPNRGGASLINDRWAVTAAHVVDGIEETSLELFGRFVALADTNKPDRFVINSRKIIVHPGYRKGIASNAQTNFDNDIALVRFSSRVKLGPNLLPICLPQVNMDVSVNELGTVSGMGMTDFNNQLRMISLFLKYAHITVLSQAECRNTPNKTMTFTDNMFCAGASGKDSCSGDSGGPFFTPMLSAGAGPYYLTGIVSWGAPCKEESITSQTNKGYYTKVANYVEWIKDTIEKEEHA
ncbi:complement C1s subcomponent [Melanotaenia boesemani]|uniref:complement C1s subcomponent n=1 Tax=Melanotaenia boesemani TaxID=1250792 RepID=UPI001C04C527|nr:complement C1s subcomponent [Melanotaenia boesemani]